MSGKDTQTQTLGGTKIYDPIKVGSKELSVRIVLAPLTRYRAANDHEPSDLQLEYYAQRSQYSGTLLTTEATFITAEDGGYANIPGIWSESQTKGWKKIVDAVHAKGSFINAQLWSLGRMAEPDYLASKGLKYISSSELYIDDETKKLAEKHNNPIHALTKPEIKEHVQNFVKAAKNAIFGAGFDFVEIHSANGYLLDQFLQPVSNHRTDEYGGSVENRARFLFEVVDAVSEAVGSDKVSVRLSPWGKFGGMGGDADPTIIPTYSYVVAELQKRRDAGKDIAYLSIVEPRVSGDNDAHHVATDNNWILLIYKGIVLRTGAFASTTPDYTRIFHTVSGDDRTLIGIGRHFLANPDLLKKLHDGIALNPYKRETFYTNGSLGYTTYPNAGENEITEGDPEGQREPKPLV